MRKIKGIIIHCAATKPTMNIGAKEINDWHLQRGWSGIGYHFVIKRNGDLETGRDLLKDGAHCKGNNKDTIGVCLVGGINHQGQPENNFTKEQWSTLETLITDLSWEDFMIGGFYIKGHNEFSSKACPSFDVQEWLKSVGLNK